MNSKKGQDVMCTVKRTENSNTFTLFYLKNINGLLLVFAPFLFRNKKHVSTLEVWTFDFINLHNRDGLRRSTSYMKRKTLRAKRL